MHPRCLTSGWSDPPRVIEREGRKYFLWRRTKKKGARGMTMIPVAKELLPFAESYLEILPGRRQTYNEILQILAGETMKRYPRLKNIRGLCPLRLRHTFGVNMLRAGMAPHELMQLMNVSSGVLRFYLALTPEQLAKKLEQVGFS